MNAGPADHKPTLITTLDHHHCPLVLGKNATEWLERLIRRYVSYLHHEQNSVKHNESHDEILKGRGLDDPPQLVFEPSPLLRHVPLQRGRVDGKIDARFLKH